jgi:hypothetical protein
MVRFRHEDAARNTATRINRFPGCINHRPVRPNRSETFSYIPAAGGAAEIDISEYYVNQRLRLA